MSEEDEWGENVSQLSRTSDEPATWVQSEDRGCGLRSLVFLLGDHVAATK